MTLSKDERLKLAQDSVRMATAKKSRAPIFKEGDRVVCVSRMPSIQTGSGPNHFDVGSVAIGPSGTIYTDPCRMMVFVRWDKHPACGVFRSEIEKIKECDASVKDPRAVRCHKCGKREFVMNSEQFVFDTNPALYAAHDTHRLPSPRAWIPFRAAPLRCRSCAAMPLSYKCEVLTNRTEWTANALRFATGREALASGSELLSRWFVPTDYRAVPTDDPVNYRFDFEAYKNVSLAQEGGAS